MIEPETVFFLIMVAVGALVQTVSGFAMGLVIVAAVTVFDLYDIRFTAAVVSLVSLLNTVVALRTSHRLIDRRYLVHICVTLVPCMLIGVFVLNVLTEMAYHWLKAILGIVIIIAGVLLMLKPTAWNEGSNRIGMWLVGAFGGVIAGLYSAGGAPLAYFMYRQPLDISIIRATLLSFFAVSTVGRTAIVAVDGHVTSEVLSMAAISVPVVFIVTIGAGRVLGQIPEILVRRLVFYTLIIMGVFLTVTSVV